MKNQSFNTEKQNVFINFIKESYFSKNDFKKFSGQICIYIISEYCKF